MYPSTHILNGSYGRHRRTPRKRVCLGGGTGGVVGLRESHTCEFRQTDRKPTVVRLVVIFCLDEYKYYRAGSSASHFDF
jgi:hypothetical protein